MIVQRRSGVDQAQPREFRSVDVTNDLSEDLCYLKALVEDTRSRSAVGA